MRNVQRDTEKSIHAASIFAPKVYFGTISGQWLLHSGD